MKFNLKKIARAVCSFMLILTFSLGFLLCVPKVSKNSQKTADATNNYVAELLEDHSALESDFDISKLYPVYAENQTGYDFCWIYSSLKALETSLMIQRGLYYNFSEAAVAYYNYKEMVEEVGGAVQISTNGDFNDFVTLFNRYGVVFESDFSNDLCGDITFSNYQSFNYVENYSVKNIKNEVVPFELHRNLTYNNLTNIEIVKRYIKAYGGLFTGIEEGTLYVDNGKNLYTSDLGKDAGIYKRFYQPHAVCVIGWNDNIVMDGSVGGFLAVNSWGFDRNSYDYFYIPYAYAFIYNTFSGFICSETEPMVEVVDSSALKFTSTVLGSPIASIPNIFCYNDNVVGIEYKFNINDLRVASVTITNGMQDYTDYFSVVYDNAGKTITIRKNTTSSGFFGGYYSVRFFENETLKAIESFYIYSGTEIGGFIATTTGSKNELALNNAFLSNSNSATFYVNSAAKYNIHFNLLPINSCTNLIRVNENCKFLNYEVDSVSLTRDGEISAGPTITQYLQGQHVTILDRSGIEEGEATYYDQINSYPIEIRNLSAIENCVLSVKLKIHSVLYGCYREFTLHFVVTSNTVLTYDKSADYAGNPIVARTVNYILDGGVNNPLNLKKFPNYEDESSDMTSIPLYNPTKVGYIFLGWFGNANGVGTKVTNINMYNTNDVTLYAIWEKENLDYYDMSFELTAAQDYYGNPKSLSDGLVYGDSITFDFGFIKHTDLNGKNYTFEYYFYYDGIQIESGPRNQSVTSASFGVGSTELEAGNHSFEIYVIVVVSNEINVTKTQIIELDVDKKNVTFGFSDLRYTYDGQLHCPTITIADGSVFDEDLIGISQNDLFVVSNDASHRDAGTYNYQVLRLTNDNYEFDANSAKCQMIIDKKSLSVDWLEYDVVYDGQVHLPRFNLVGVVPGDSVNVGLNSSDFVNAGDYSVNVVPETINNSNYYVILENNARITIKKAKIVIFVSDVTDRIQTKVADRRLPEYTFLGTIYRNDELGIHAVSSAFDTNISGVYEVGCKVDNPNYECEVHSGQYTLTGYYKVFYQLPNGKTYIETVEEGQMPIGITKKDIKAPALSRVKYSDEYVITGDDIYVAVLIEDYSPVVYWGVFIGVFLIVVIVFYYKKRDKGVA